jgi:hypothetical protein
VQNTYIHSSTEDKEICMNELRYEKNRQASGTQTRVADDPKGMIEHIVPMTWSTAPRESRRGK